MLQMISLSKDDCNGFLLYGYNSVDETSLIRALGISIIMAQAGMCSMQHL